MSDAFIVVKKIYIKELKGLKNCTIEFTGPLTAIMGVNGIGKTTVIHALACSFRKKTDFGDEKRFPHFFPPTSNATWKNSNFTISYDVVNKLGDVMKCSSTDYSKSYDRWAPRYASQPKLDIKYIGIESCTPQIELFKQERVKFVTHPQEDRTSAEIIRRAGSILNKNYKHLTENESDKRKFLGVITGNNLAYSSLSMGAGEQRVFRMLSVFLKAPKYSMILIDEIDLLLHPNALKELIKNIHEIAKAKHLQVIFTTHSLVMKDLMNYVEIKYLDVRENNVYVFNNITSAAWRELSGDKIHPLKIYVEDEFSKAIVKNVARKNNMSAKIQIDVFGAAENAFTLAASFVMTKRNNENILIILDGDVFRETEEKNDAIKRHLVGSDLSERREEALNLITSFNLPEDKGPEEFLHSLLADKDGDTEIIQSAKRINAVRDKHDWIRKIADELDDNSETIISVIISACSECDGWDEYVRPIEDWILSKGNI